MHRLILVREEAHDRPHSCRVKWHYARSQSALEAYLTPLLADSILEEPKLKLKHKSDLDVHLDRGAGPSKNFTRY